MTHNPLSSSKDPSYIDIFELERRTFDEEFSELFNPRNSSARLLFSFIRRELHAFHLEGRSSEAYILNEAYLRGTRQIGKIQVYREILPQVLLKACCGLSSSFSSFDLDLDNYMLFWLSFAYALSTQRAIRNPPAWLRGTIRHIIRELSRSHKKHDSSIGDIADYEIAAEPSPSLEEDLHEDLSILQRMLLDLPFLDQRLLTLKVVEELSWREIRTVLRLEGHGDLPEQILRKRKERALIKLRKKYHAVKLSVF
jgi:DNA-directed RNA polymerase specialized sigma24 family protein